MFGFFCFKANLQVGYDHGSIESDGGRILVCVNAECRISGAAFGEPDHLPPGFTLGSTLTDI